MKALFGCFLWLCLILVVLAVIGSVVSDDAPEDEKVVAKQVEDKQTEIPPKPKKEAPPREAPPVASKKPEKVVHPVKYEVMEQNRRPYQGRNRILMKILAPKAKETDVIIKTMMEAAVNTQMATNAHVVSVSLYHKKKDSGIGIIEYSVDGCGWTKGECGKPSPWTSLTVWEQGKGGMLTAVKKIPDYLADDYSPPSPEQLQAANEKACDADLQCWMDKWIIEASLHCKSAVESQARYAHQWTDGWLDMKFPRARWKDRSKGILSYWGDKVQFQNGFGAWVKMAYWCDFNPYTKEAKARVFQR